jgi:hypothetical protein
MADVMHVTRHECRKVRTAIKRAMEAPAGDSIPRILERAGVSIAEAAPVLGVIPPPGSVMARQTYFAILGAAANAYAFSDELVSA